MTIAQANMEVAIAHIVYDAGAPKRDGVRSAKRLGLRHVRFDHGRPAFGQSARDRQTPRGSVDLYGVEGPGAAIG